MAINVGVKALLGWLNGLKLAERNLNVEDLTDGMFLLKAVHKLKKEPDSSSTQSTDDRFKLLAEFLERDGRFSSDRGASLSWDSIRNGVNLEVEVSKVLLLLVYHDIMNDHSILSLNTLEYEVEQEIATLTKRFVQESDNCVFLSSEVDAYLRKKYLRFPIARIEGSTTSSASSLSPLSLSDESPIFHRSPKVKFVDLQTVASSSVSRSPLQDVMNTPQFQLRKMKRQMIRESGYRDGLESELAGKMALIVQRESQIGRLQFHLDKLKEDRDQQEEAARKQMDELETKNNKLHLRLSELLEQNQDMKSNSSYMERKVDELTDENGVLSAQVREVCSQLCISEAEIRRLTETQDSAQEEWSSKTLHLQSELKQSTAQQEFLTEQIQILQGKISCLDDELSRITKEEKGENMGPFMEVEKERLQQEEVMRLNEEIQVKKEELVTLKNESSTHSELLQQEIQSLKNQVERLGESLKKAEEQLQTQVVMLTMQEQGSALEKERLEQQMSVSEGEVRKMKEEMQAKEEQINLLKNESSEQSELLCQEIQGLKNQVESLSSSLEKSEEVLAKQQQENTKQRDVLQEQMVTSQEEVKKLKEELQAKEEAVQAKEQLLDRTQQERAEQEQLLQEQIYSCKGEILKLKESQSEKENLLLKAEEKLESLQTELTTVNRLLADKDQNLNGLREELSVQAALVGKAKEEVQTKEDILVKVQEESSKQRDVLQHEIQNLKSQMENISGSLKKAEETVLAKDQLLLKTQQECAQQLALVNTDLSQHREMQAAALIQKEALQELQTATQRENEVLVQAKEALIIKIHQAAESQKALEKQLEVLGVENEKCVQAIQAMEKDNKTSHRLATALQQELTSLKTEKVRLHEEREKAEQREKLSRDRQEQLLAKAEAAEHYKAQMEKAVSHYNGKKQLLQESQEQLAMLQRSLEVKEHQVNAVTTEITLLQLDLDKARSNEKSLLSSVASLEAQLAFADRNLREQNKIRGNGATESSFFEVPRKRTRAQTQVQMEKLNNSSDSLEQSSLEDSLNATRRPSGPEESSTPLVRSSERLAAKRRTESLETLYFTPLNSRQVTRGKEPNLEHSLTFLNDLGLDSARRNPTSSVKRRRTTQVINITMTKKTPGRGEGDSDDTFYSLASARSQPNLSNAHSSRRGYTELFDAPGEMAGAASDHLLSLPGYRRSTASATHPRATSAENEPDGASDDWMRIAEIQARNKAVRPHLKSSYPVESGPAFAPPSFLTDEDIRMGDPSDTIRRGSMMPGQLQDSLASHRLSVIMGQTGVGSAATTHSHRHSLMPGQFSSKTVSYSQLQSPKGTKRPSSTLSLPQSPERRVKASCFPQLTPKQRSSGASSAQIRPALSPVDRRQSMAFTVDNTPRKNSYLQKGLNKLRSSTRKSPGKTSKKSPGQRSSRKSPGNMGPAASRTGVGRATRVGGVKSPQVATRGHRKSPRATGSTAKSPGLTASARKMIFRMKV